MQAKAMGPYGRTWSNLDAGVSCLKEKGKVPARNRPDNPPPQHPAGPHALILWGKHVVWQANGFSCFI